MSRQARPRRKPADCGARHLQRGRQAESIACDWLQQQGLELLIRNYRCRAGELDLVMMDAGMLVIVEIRYRHDPGFTHPLETVTPAKQRRIIRATRHLLQRHPRLCTHPLRFDVLALSGPIRQARLDWVKYAFDPPACA